MRARSALMTLSRHSRARFGRPLPDVPGNWRSCPFPGVWRPIALQLDLTLAGWWASPYLGRKRAIPKERDLMRDNSAVARLRRSWPAVGESGERHEAGVP